MQVKTHITDFLEFHAQNIPDKKALVTDAITLSWAQLNERVQKTAANLQAEIGQHKEQQVIGLLFPNSWVFVVVYLAILKLGHIAMPLDPSYKHLEIEVIVKQLPPKVVVTQSDQKPLLEGVETPLILAEDMFRKPNKDSVKDCLRLSAEEQIATLVFTSGTTGKPKASTYSHANHIWNIVVCSEAWNWTAEDSLLISLPLSHWYGIVMGLSGIIYHGNTLYLQRWFDEKATLEDLAAGKATMYTAISAAYFKLLDEPGDYDLSKVLCISGGAALPPAIWESFKNRFKTEILECYGSSETGRIASNLLNERIPGSPGRPLRDVNLKISEDNEVLIKSPGIFPGYYKNPQLTKKNFTQDGWWHTGDLGEIKNGRIALKGRTAERIRKQAYSISPRDIEWAMHKNPDIKEIYVMGVQRPDQPSDELVYFVSTRLSEEEINAYCKENLLYAWRPDRIIFVDSLPRTRNGKPKVAKLREMAGVDS